MMKKNDKTDKICIEKILRYIGDIKECFEFYDIKSHSDLESKRLAGYAVTQILTNIYAAKQKLTNEALMKLPEFDRIKLAGARNIAGHDYDRVNFEMIYDFCNMLLSDKIKSELSEVLNDEQGQPE